MKATRRLLALVMVIAVIMAMAISASAATITINNAAPGTYNAYKVLDVEVNGITGAYRYKLTSDDWATFVNGRNGTDVTVAANYVTHNPSFNAVTFADAAIQYATTNSIAATATTSSGSIDLADGYYVMSSPVGNAPIAFTVVNGTIKGVPGNTTISEKSTLPRISKTVNGYEETTANIGDTLTYRITLTAAAGTDAYSIEDVLPAGITNVSVVSADKGTATYDSVNHKISWTISATDREALADNEEIVITYTAVLDSDAVIASTGNRNTATLSYGEDLTIDDTATVFTYQFKLIKTDGTDVLEGAEFELTDGSSNVIKFTYDAVNKTYTVSTDVSASAVITAGEVTIKGLANGTYTLTETQSPAGYTGADPVTVTISNANAVDVTVVNTPGEALPETGGIGTTLFYAVGGLMVVAAVVLLVTKKRMSV